MWKQKVWDAVVHALMIVGGSIFALLFLKFFGPLIEAPFSTSTVGGRTMQTTSTVATSSARGMALDANGNIYVTGASNGTWGNPIRAFAGGDRDAFVAKLDSNGTLIWNTFLGGSESDFGYAIAVDPKGDIYIAGNSWSSWGSPVHPFHSFVGWLLFPAFERPKPAAFVAKLDSNGTLLWNTFPASTSASFAQAIAVDGMGNVGVTGISSENWGWPVHSLAGPDNAFVARLNSHGFLVWNTFVDSGWNDSGNDIALDATGNTYVTGQSSSRNPIKTSAFVAKLDNRGVQVWNILLGSKDRYAGSNGTGIALDRAGNIYMTGMSSAFMNSDTWGSPVNAYAGDADAFVAKLDGNGGLVWNTFAGGGGSDWGDDIALDADANAYILGFSKSNWGTPVRSFTDDPDAFVAKLNSTGARAWNTFLGGRGEDFGMGIAADRYGNVYTVGTSSTAWGNPLHSIFPPSEHSTSFSEAFVAKLSGNTGALTWNTFLGSTVKAP